MPTEAQLSIDGGSWSVELEESTFTVYYHLTEDGFKVPHWVSYLDSGTDAYLQYTLLNEAVAAYVNAGLLVCMPFDEYLVKLLDNDEN